MKKLDAMLVVVAALVVGVLVLSVSTAHALDLLWWIRGGWGK